MLRARAFKNVLMVVEVRYFPIIGSGMMFYYLLFIEPLYLKNGWR